MEINSNTMVGEIVRENFKTAQIFDKKGIDFCCGGAISLEQACADSKIDLNEIVPEIEAILQVNDPDSTYMDGLSLDELTEYIEKRHHTYVNDNLLFIQQKLQKLCEVHGENHPELFEIKSHFFEASGNLTLHMKNEELVLFPYVKALVQFKDGEGEKPQSFGKVKETIDQMIGEHEAEGERFEMMSQLSNNYTCPPDGCTTFQVTYQSLKDFEKDLHRHIHLENNLLFKKVVVLESELL